MSIARIMMQAAAGSAGGGGVPIEEAFSADLYTGNGSTQTITNGIDLAGEGGLVWFKRRDTTGNNRVYDTERGMTAATGGAPYLYTNDTAANLGTGFAGSVVATSTGFDITQGAIGDISDSGGTYASWTFRKAPRFFDVVTFKGDGTAYRTLSHDLGVRPGAIVIKRTDSTGDWFFMHRGNTTTSWFHTGSSGGNPDFGKLNTTDAFTYLGASTSACYAWIGTNDTSFEITGGDPTEFAANITGATYVAYLYAHDPLGPSGDGSDGLIACGSYTGNATSLGPAVNLGWKPQWLLVKNTNDGSESWHIHDDARDTSNPRTAVLRPNTADAELDNVGYSVNFDSTGFQAVNSNGAWNADNQVFLYIAIRAEGV